MTDANANPYLRDAVMTASPAQLQLMLYDGAIRFAGQGRDAIVGKEFETSYQRLTRAQRIVLELQQGLRHEVAPDLCEQMAALYMFVYRKLVDGCVYRDTAAIDEALRVLNYQRETWVMLINQLNRPPDPDTVDRGASESGDQTLSVHG